MSQYIELDTAKQVFNQLMKDKQLLNQLCELLDEERHALEKRDDEALESALSRKQQLLNALNQNRLEREKLLSPMVPHSESDPIDWVVRGMPQGPADKLRTLYDQVQSLLEQSQTKTQVNARIVDRSRQALDHLLALLCGRDGNEAEGVYQANGRYVGEQHIAQHALARA